MNATKHTPTPWGISQQAHGTFLMHDSFCVAKLPAGADEAVALYRIIDAHDALTARVAELEKALSKIAGDELRHPDEFEELRAIRNIARAVLKDAK